MIQDEIRKAIFTAIKKFYPNIKINLDDIELERPQNPEYGDFATNISFKIANKLDKSFENITEELYDYLVDRWPTIGIEEIGLNFYKKGFINFKYNDKLLGNQILEIIKQGEKFSSSNIGKGDKVQVEFISANPTGPLTLGNGRGGFFGDILANVLERAGFKVEREYYINDTGNQIEILGKSILATQGKIKPEEDFYKGKYVSDLTKKIKEENPIKIGEVAAKIILNDIQKSIKNLHIKFDRWFSEKYLQEKSEVKKAIDKLKEKKLVYKKEGALWFKATEIGDNQDWVLVKSDGQFTYFASDIAYHLDKFAKRKYAKVIDFWGADHAGHVRRLKKAMKVFDYDEKLDIIICQLVRLMKGDKEIKMSKRLGTYITLNELIDEVGLDVARFFFVMKAPDTHMDFDLKLAKEQSAKNPVYYVQYAYARIHSILAKSKVKSQKSKVDLSLLKHPAEINLIKKLTKLPEIIEDTAKDYQVQRLPFYAIELATKFHDFYEKCKVISDDKDLTAARLNLILATKVILKNTLDLIGIKAPKRM